ncbi:MAG: SdpI family protein [Candidatus Gracilibacteria bacterium]|nr:SdpI family protein [Candidatus Gracilibacteria bacterium]
MKKYFYIKLIIIALMVLVGLYFYGKLPDIIPHHWNYKGVADAFGPKIYTMVMMPSLGILLLALFHFIPKIDPNKYKYDQFRDAWEKMQITILAYFAYIYFVIIYVILNPGSSINFFMFLGIGTFFMILGNYMGKVRKNYFVGVRTPWTLANEEVWNRTQRFTGKMFFLSGLLLFLDAFLNVFVVGIFIFMIVTCIFGPFIYSYIEFKRITDAKKS